MSKRIFILLGIVIAIIISSATISLILKRKASRDALPHFKQAFIKYKGLVVFLADQEYTLDLLFVDEKEYSEFFKDYIQSIELVSADGTKYKMTDWNFSGKQSEKKYCLKKISSKLKLSETGLICISSIKAYFYDGSVETHNLGSLLIKVIKKSIMELVLLQVI